MQSRMVRLLSVCAVIVSATVMSIPMAGIMGVFGKAAAADETVTLTVGFMQEVDSLNPYVGLNDAAYFFYGLVYDALGVIDEDMNPIPDLTKEAPWAVPESDPEMVANGLPFGSVWQYNLTHNATWSNGELFTAEDVAYNVNLNAWNYDFMWAYQPYSYFMEEARALDDYTVRIYFWDKITGDPQPASYAYLISIPILPKHKLQDLGGAEDIGFTWEGVFPDEDIPIVATGPWLATEDIYEEWLAGDHITLVRNENYHWGPDKGMYITFDRLLLKFYEDSTSLVYALRQSDIDIAAFPPQSYRSIYTDVQGGDLDNVDTFHGPKVTQYWTEILFNMNEGGDNQARLDKNVRHALAMATDKSFIIDNYYLGYADEGSTLIPPINEYWHYEPNETERFDYNLDAARALLEASGYTDTNSDGIREARSWSAAVQNGWVPSGTPLHFEMLIRREYPEEKDIAVYLKAIWEQIGVSITYDVIDESELGTIVYSYQYDTAIWYWSADIDPNYQLFVVTQMAWYGWSDTKYYNASYDANYLMSVSTLDKEQRREYVYECQRIYYEDCPYIILAYAYTTHAWRTDTFEGWGDWAAHPGRELDNFWMGHPLFFDLNSTYVPPPPREFPWVLVIAGIAGAAVVVAAVVLLRKRGGKKAGKDEGESPIGD